jgi:hypothetical protein
MEMDGPTWYEIRVKSHLDDSLADAFGMAVRRETSDETILYGPLPDQAALHGVLMRIRDLGLILVTVKSLIPNHQQSMANNQDLDSGL